MSRWICTVAKVPGGRKILARLPQGLLILAEIALGSAWVVGTIVAAIIYPFAVLAAALRELFKFL